MKKKNINLAIIEDNHFFNKLVSGYITNYLKGYFDGSDWTFSISSFTNGNHFMKSKPKNIDIAIVDYYLGEGVTCNELIPLLKEEYPTCEVCIMSSDNNLFTSVEPLKIGGSAFLHKQDKKALYKACLFVEKVFSSSFKHQ